jgi:hypothetical protein
MDGREVAVAPEYVEGQENLLHDGPGGSLACGKNYFPRLLHELVLS